MIIFKMALLVFAVLFFINWVCLMAAQRFHGFPLGDFVLVALACLVLVVRAPDLAALGRQFPDTLEMISAAPRQQAGRLERSWTDTAQTAQSLAQYLLGLVARDMGQRMRYETPQ